jgi:hypothetical protein
MQYTIGEGETKEIGIREAKAGCHTPALGCDGHGKCSELVVRALHPRPRETICTIAFHQFGVVILNANNAPFPRGSN